MAKKKAVKTVPVGRDAVQRAKMTTALRNTTINGKPVTYEQWKRGDLLKALTAKPKATAKATPKAKAKTVYPARPVGYDIGLDIQEDAAKRGYRYNIDDLIKGRERAATDFGVAQGDITRQQGEVARQYGENLSDLLKARSRGSEDYNTNLQTIARNFSQLGNQQAQQGRRAGLEGGFAQQAARKRAANEAITRAPVDTGYGRFSADSALDETRLGEARQRSLDEIDRYGGQVGEQYRRSGEDFGVTEERTGTEFQNYLLDIAKTRQDQSRQPFDAIKLPVPKKPLTAAQRMKASLRNTTIKGKPVSYAQWKRGDLLSALVGKSKAKGLMATRGRI